MARTPLSEHGPLWHAVQHTVRHAVLHSLAPAGCLARHECQRAFLPPHPSATCVLTRQALHPPLCSTEAQGRFRHFAPDHMDEVLEAAEWDPNLMIMRMPLPFLMGGADGCCDECDHGSHDEEVSEEEERGSDEDWEEEEDDDDEDEEDENDDDDDDDFDE